MVGYQRSVCLKTVTFGENRKTFSGKFFDLLNVLEYGNRRTQRVCTRAGPRKDPCLETRNAIDVSVCEICDHHLCNGSTVERAKLWMVFVLPVAAVFKSIQLIKAFN